MRKIQLALVLALALGCGGEPTEEAQPQSTSGGEDVAATSEMAPPMDEGVPEPEPEPEPEGPAQLSVTVKVGFDETPLPVRVLNADGDEVAASGSAEAAFTLPAGDYTVVVAVTDAQMLADTPEKRESVSLAPAEERNLLVEFPRARVRLRVRRNHRELRRARVELRRAGSDETVVDYRTSNDYLPISAGRYTAIVHAANQEITVNDMIFMEGSSRDMPIDIN